METVSHNRPTLRQSICGQVTPPWWPPSTHTCTDGKHTPLTPKLLQNLLAPTHTIYRHAVLFNFPQGCNTFSEPHDGTRDTEDGQRALQGADEQQDERSWAVLSWCLSLCPSTSSYLHIVDCTHLTGRLFPKPQCPLPPTHYNHSINVEHNSHQPPPNTLAHPPLLLPSPVGLRSVSESAYGDL